MWIKKGTFIINTDNIAAIYLKGDKLFFRFPGPSASGSSDRPAFISETWLGEMTPEVVEKIWQAYINKKDFIDLDSFVSTKNY